MMQRAGFEKNAAGGLLAAGGLGAILSPPVLGAAAFLIAEFLKISYLDVIWMATIPTCLYYLSLLFMVELDAKRFGANAVVTEQTMTLGAMMKRYGFHFTSLIAVIVFMIVGYLADAVGVLLRADVLPAERDHARDLARPAAAAAAVAAAVGAAAAAGPRHHAHPAPQRHPACQHPHIRHSAHHHALCRLRTRPAADPARRAGGRRAQQPRQRGEAAHPQAHPHARRRLDRRAQRRHHLRVGRHHRRRRDAHRARA